MVVTNPGSGYSGTQTFSFSAPTSGNTATSLTSTAATGSGGLTKLGSNTLTLGGANTYLGVTTISAGTLKLNTTGANNIASSAAIVVASGANLDVNTATGGVTGSGGFALSNLASQTLHGKGQVLGGTGNVTNGPVTVGSTSVISAGTSIALGTGSANAVGTLTTAGETWAGNGEYSTKAAGSTGATTWDQIQMTTLSVGATAPTRRTSSMSLLLPR